jgi:hypothetical protein
MHREGSADSKKPQKNMKKTKSVDKIRGFSKAVKNGKSDSCCGGHISHSAERVVKTAKKQPPAPQKSSDA